MQARILGWVAKNFMVTKLTEKLT